jgi:hypothetical protein
MPRFIDSTEFKISHFRKHRALVDSHVSDCNEPWYDEVFETSYRIPDKLPLTESLTILAYTKYTPSCGKAFDGYSILCKYATKNCPHLMYHPAFWQGGGFHHFWHGRVDQFGMNDVDKARAALSKVCAENLHALFPIVASIEKSIVGREIVFDIEGFGFYSDKNNTISIQP